MTEPSRRALPMGSGRPRGGDRLGAPALHPGPSTGRPPAPAGLVVAAFLMTMSSAFGQTNFIAIFLPSLKAELSLSDGGVGALYTMGTLASACLLAWAGKVADLFPIRWLAVAVLAGLAMTCLAMASVPASWLLLPILFGLRFFGQGALGHLAVTGVGRWYVRRRGKMMAIAVLGFAASDAVMPVSAVTLSLAIGWRQTWVAAAGLLCLVSIPLVLALLRGEPRHDVPPPDHDGTEVAKRHWTRAEVLRRPEFFGILSGIVVPSFVMTGIFFQQANLVAEKGWTLAWFAGWFSAYAGVSVCSTLATGLLVDRFDTTRLLPLFLLPMCAGVLVLALSTSPLAVPAFMILAALTAGSSSTLIGTLWAELFGTRHLGAIRSVAFAAQVVASALAPGLLGILLDLGVRLEEQCLGLAIYSLASSLWLIPLVPRLHRLARA